METTSQRSGLFAAAFLAGAVTGAAVLALSLPRPWTLKQRQLVEEVHQPRESAPAASSSQMGNMLQDEVLAEQFTRNVQFFGAEGQQRIADAFVIVVGLGGVGSHAAHMLLRSGVGRLRLIDFDQVSLSSLNRHAVATREDVGTPKSECLKEHFLRILPEAQLEAVNAMYTAEEEDALLAGRPDFVLDAIDNIDTKVALLAACRRRGIPVLCSAGAGAKADPTRLHIADLRECNVDPLARAVRQRLRRDHGVDCGVPVLLSTERPRCGLLPVEQVGPNPADFQVVPGFRVRTVPVLGSMPASFGMAAAGHILCQLAGQPFTPAPLLQLQSVQFATQLDRLREREELRFGSAKDVHVDLDDVRYLVRELWQAMSAHRLGVPAAGSGKGLHRDTSKLVLIRWNASQPADVVNMVLMTFDEAEQHEAVESLAKVQQQQPELFSFVEACLQRARSELLGETPPQQQHKQRHRQQPLEQRQQR